MTEPILDPGYWRRRIELAPHGEPHQAVFRCHLSKWKLIEAKHKEILASLIKPTDSILDIGCGWGRLLSLLPREWKGRYTGMDISPDFIALADKLHAGPDREFHVGDMRLLDTVLLANKASWAVMISIRPMVIRNLGEADWAAAERQIRRLASKLLFLEYDENDPGSVE